MRLSPRSHQMPAKALTCHSQVKCETWHVCWYIKTNLMVQNKAWWAICTGNRRKQGWAPVHIAVTDNHQWIKWENWLWLSQLLISLHEALLCFQSVGPVRSASYLSNMESVLCQNIIVPVSHRERSNRKKKKKILSRFHHATANLAQWWLEGRWAVVLSQGLVLKWDYRLVWKKEEGGGDAQASKRAEIFKCRQTHSSKEIILSSLVGKRKGGGGDS